MKFKHDPLDGNDFMCGQDEICIYEMQLAQQNNVPGLAAGKSLCRLVILLVPCGGLRQRLLVKACHSPTLCLSSAQVCIALPGSC